MKLIFAVVFVVSIDSGACATGSLRSHSLNRDQSNEQGTRRVEASLQMKENPNNSRLFQGNVQPNEENKEATGEKHQLAKAVLDEPMVGARNLASSTLTLRESTSPIQEKSESSSNLEINIVGGEMSDDNEFPYYVGMGGCGGTLIGPDIVLGAAHCGGYVGQTVTIGTSIREVVDGRMHPSYNSDTSENDFFLHRLGSPVTTTGAQVTLNNDPAAPWAGQALTILGLGLTSEGGSASDSLRDVAVPTISDTGCESAYGSSYVSDVMFCAGEGGKDSCQGDSGGPIVIRQDMEHVLVGVVSFGIGCARPEYPGIYARVSAAIPWFQSVGCAEWGSSVNGLCGASTPVATPTQSPTVALSTPAPFSMPTPAEVPVAAPTDGTCTSLTVIFRSDGYPEENSIVLTDAIDGRILWNYNTFEPDNEHAYERCLPTSGCTILDVTDTYGDGLLSNGIMKVIWGSQVLYDKWNLGSGFYIRLGNGC